MNGKLFSALFTSRAMRLAAIVGWCGVTTALTPGAAMAKGGVNSSPHNLSASGGRGKHSIAFSEEKRVCVFCHTPHSPMPAQPLWNRDLPPDSGYTPYDSSTLKAVPKPDKPTGASRLCLSCHDGTIALGQFGGSPIPGGGQTIPSDPVPTLNPNLTSDLSDDHPISFAYTDALAAQAQLASPAALPAQVRLSAGQVLQCTGCHDPHNNEFGNFLVIDNSAPGSPLCVACHQNTGWPGSTHNPANSPPLAAGCANCHYVHSAPEGVRLLRRQKEEENCFLSCHNGVDPASVNVKPLFDPTMHRHPVDLTQGIHDENEALPAGQYHVECVDCHNPHQVNGSGAPLSSPPNIDGRLAGVRKDTVGTVATTEYDICYKCHSGGNSANFSGITETNPNRVIPDPDQMNRFDGLNPSFHPVAANRRSNGASLLVPLQASMIRVYCSDCHNSDQSVKAGGGGANGPHGSQFEHILMARYDMPDPSAPRQPYSASLYDLCFRCHAESFIMGSSSGFVNTGVNEHVKHVQERGLPCFACHDPHGVPWKSGATAQNNAHLINFDKPYAAGATVPNPSYSTLAPANGSCTVNCHTVGGSTHSYAP